MRNKFREMDCFVLAGGRTAEEDFSAHGDLTRLERGYRRYAAVFEKVRLVLKRDQAREKYLNYPFVCGESGDWDAIFGIDAALRSSDSEAVFIGSSDITDFPLELAVELVRKYNGEAFLGYIDASKGASQPLFGIYSQKLAPKIMAVRQGDIESLRQVIAQEGRFIPLPDSTQAEQLNLR